MNRTQGDDAQIWNWKLLDATTLLERKLQLLAWDQHSQLPAGNPIDYRSQSVSRSIRPQVPPNCLRRYSVVKLQVRQTDGMVS